MQTVDAITVLEKLSSAQIVARLEELDREGRALRVLLRAARARERKCRLATPDPTTSEGARHAD
jgi:hypothetical protein